MSAGMPSQPQAASSQLPVQQPQPHEAARQVREYSGMLALHSPSGSLNPVRQPDKLEDTQVR
jgi:hypothetical protein